MLNPLQNAAQASKVIESFAKVVLGRARPVVDSVQHPWYTQLSIVYLIAGPVCVGAAEEAVVDERVEIVSVDDITELDPVLVEGGETDVRLTELEVESEVESEVENKVEVFGEVAAPDEDELASALLAS
jgi:hypothetical protein